MDFLSKFFVTLEKGTRLVTRSKYIKISIIGYFKRLKFTETVRFRGLCGFESV